MKKALVTGVTGQDGSYLAEFLLKKGYEVHGLARRSSSFNRGRIEHLYIESLIKDAHHKRLFKLHYGDMTDSTSLNRVIHEVRPDEIYNLAAQSHVKVSFEMPEYTADVDAMGVLRLLEAVRSLRDNKKVKIYQASTSELFGKVQEIPQKETTPFYPRSPYGVAKLYAFWAIKNYRESYGLFACNGILFNHETIASFMPMFCKRTDEKEFDIKPIREIVSFDESNRRYQGKEVSGIQVWGKGGWVAVGYASAYPHDVAGDNKKPRFINSRSGAFMATSSHVGFMEDGQEKETGDMVVGDSLEAIDLPEPAPYWTRNIAEEEAELLGMMVGDGSISFAKKGIGVNAKFTNSSAEIRDHFSHLWSKVTGGNTKYYPSRSGFNPEKIVGQLSLVDENDWLRSADIYNRDQTKRVPKAILNSGSAAMIAFLRGYNATDGLKSNPCTYEFRNFKTNSPTLAMGLWYLIDKTTKQEVNLTVETKSDGRIFYSLNLLSTVDNLSKEVEVQELEFEGTSQREISRITGISRGFIRKIQRGGAACLVHPLRKDTTEVKKIIEMPHYDGWFYDLETSSGEFHCGIGKTHVHNSPRRGENFVSRKITLAAARIVKGTQDKLYLGNLDAKRDWGYAKDFVEAMWLMLQQKAPDDYVIATGETHSVREFAVLAFREAGIELQWKGKGKYEKGFDKKTGKVLVEIDPQFYRPAEVDILVGDPSKAKKKLGWNPKKTSFNELVRITVRHDFENA